MSKFSTHRVSQQSTLANFVQVLEQLKLMLPFGRLLRMPMRPISSYILCLLMFYLHILCHIKQNITQINKDIHCA